ncbi:MAG: acyltransferase [Bacteroidaceae bacterium]|nr:acyltransferase [Bacteroidaceae bacterium]
MQRSAYLDLIRFVAMLMVAICHACDPFNAGATYGTGEVDENMFFWGSIWGSCVRACVPLFVMVTGALCLDTRRTMQHFWKKRISRVFWPFLIWSVLYNMFPFFVGLLGLPESTVYDFFVWATSSSSDFDVCMERVAEIAYRFHYIACHMWYVYMLIGLYLIIPVLSPWVRSATRRQIELVLLVWLIGTFLPYMHEFGGSYFFGECEWNQFGLLHHFTGFTGYLLLGYYIVTYIPRRAIASLIWAVPTFAVSVWITWWGFSFMTSQPDPTPEQTELFWTYCSPNVFMTSIAIFVSLRLVHVRHKFAKLLRNFAKCSFGVYMIHYFFVGPTYKLVEVCCLPTAVRVPVAAVLVIACSWAVVALLKRCFGRLKWLLG